MKDLTQLANDLEEVFKRYFKNCDDDNRVGMAIAFTLPPDYMDVHWVTNLSRDQGIDLFESTATKMRSRLN